MTSMRILLVGDSHGNISYMTSAFALAHRRECDLIFQLGDFGYYPGTFPKAMSDLTVLSGIPCYFIDGNHENFDLLYSNRVHGFLQHDGSCEVLPGLFHVPRGAIMEFVGHKFLCLGGGTSVNRYETPLFEGIDWFPDEAISMEHVNVAINNAARHNGVDFMLSHDFPLEVKRFPPLPEYWGPWAAARVVESQKMVSAVLHGSGAKTLIHGHMHTRYTEVIKSGNRSVRVEGLGCDDMPMDEATMILELDPK